MRVKMILPALTEAVSPFWHPNAPRGLPANAAQLGGAGSGLLARLTQLLWLGQHRARGVDQADRPRSAAPYVAYAAGWKKLEPLWDWVIRAQRVANLRPSLEAVLCGAAPYGGEAERPISDSYAGALVDG